MRLYYQLLQNVTHETSCEINLLNHLEFERVFNHFLKKIWEYIYAHKYCLILIFTRGSFTVLSIAGLQFDNRYLYQYLES